ncbi:hypothetical protein ON010_g6301 [Phytophthora cinnamomi]|nr:hypothetical protein ON010_g6301 [Phytophthora cinnamomi]
MPRSRDAHAADAEAFDNSDEALDVLRLGTSRARVVAADVADVLLAQQRVLDQLAAPRAAPIADILGGVDAVLGAQSSPQRDLADLGDQLGQLQQGVGRRLAHGGGLELGLDDALGLHLVGAHDVRSEVKHGRLVRRRLLPQQVSSQHAAADNESTRAVARQRLEGAHGGAGLVVELDVVEELDGLGAGHERDGARELHALGAEVGGERRHGHLAQRHGVREGVARDAHHWWR